MNQVILVGRVGQEPRQLGESGASLRVATNERGKDGQERTEWHDVVCFSWMADLAAKLQKGNEVCVIGRISTRKVQKQDGTTGYYTSVVANRLIPKSPMQQDAASAPPEDEHTGLGF